MKKHAKKRRNGTNSGEQTKHLAVGRYLLFP